MKPSHRLSLCIPPFLSGIALFLTLSPILLSMPRDTLALPPGGDSVPAYRLSYLAHEIFVGWESLRNEYLSPLRYRGNTLGYGVTTEAPLSQKHPEWLIAQSTLAGIGRTLNPARTGAVNLFFGQSRWDFLYCWRFPCGVSVAAGPGVMVEGAAEQSIRNQNNSFDARLNADLTGAVMIAYRMRMGRFVADWRLRLSSALAGIGFAPEYNESYLQAVYYDKIIRHVEPHAWGSRHFYLAGLSVDIPIWRLTTLRVSYSYTNAARLKNHIYRGRSAHGLSVGISSYFRPFRGYREVHDSGHTSTIF